MVLLKAVFYVKRKENNRYVYAESQNCQAYALKQKMHVTNTNPLPCLVVFKT